MRLRSNIVWLCLLPAVLTAQTSPDLRVREEGPGYVLLEFTPQLREMAVQTAAGLSLTRFHLLGGMEDSLAGPATPVRRIPFTIPGRQITARLVDGTFVDRRDLRIPDDLRFVRGPDFGASLVAVEASSLGRKQDLPAVEVAERTISNGRGIGVVTARPVTRRGDGSVRVYSRMLIRVDVEATGAMAKQALSILGGSALEARGAEAGTAIRTGADSPLAQGMWYRFDVTEDGIYRLDQDFFNRSNIPLASIGTIQSIRLFGNGGRILSEGVSAPRPADLLEIPRHVVDVNGNGQLDPADYILFYGSSTRGWTYTSGTKRFTHFIHPYTERNTYFLTFGGPSGRSMDSVASLSPGGLPVVNDFPEHVAVEQEKFNLVRSGRQWVGDVFDYLNNVRVYSNLLNGLVSTQPITYYFSLLSRSASIDTFSIFENDLPLGSPELMYTVDVSPSNNEFSYAYRATVGPFTRTGGVPSNRSLLKFRFGTWNQAALGWLDWFEIHYRRKFEAVSDYLQFTSPDTAASVAMTVRNLSSRSVQAFDVTDHANVKRITLSSAAFDAMDPTVCTLGVSCSSGSVQTLAIAGPNGFKAAPAATPVSNSNLRGTASPVDFLIIAPTEFLTQANRLRTHRQTHDTLQTLVVDINTIYNEFNGGLQDPMAVRDFLRYTQTSWPTKPRYVLLLGGGHYDYKNISTSVPNWIPPYETVESIYQINSYASDDLFVILDPADTRISMAIGRLPARSAQEATVLVDKIIAYETTAPLDPWRNRVTFVADDGKTTGNQDDGNMHTSYAEDLATWYTPDLYEKQKIYLIAYPTTLSAAGRRKPEVNRAIVDAVNQGTVVLNYTGHGNARLWAHEAVFTREGDLPQLTNGDRLTFLVGATCNYAQYDDPTEQSSGEIVMVMPQGGAIAVVTAARAVYSTNNAILNETLFSYLFQRTSSGMPVRIGDAMWSTKQSLFGTNDRKYHLFGDPTLRLALPRTPVAVDSVNGAPASVMATLPTLGRVRVNGSVRQSGGGLWSNYTGRAIVQLSDAQRRIPVAEWGGYSYTLNGSMLYKGEVTVSGGLFQAQFPVPKDVSFGGNARISLYAWDGTTDGSGFTQNVVIAGTDTTVLPDTTGPVVEVYFNDPSFRPGDPVPPRPTLIVRLQDASGINTSTVGIGHRLEASITNPDRIIDLSTLYRSDLDTYQSGEARTVLSDLTEGVHDVTVKAWDIRNNSAEASTTVNVRSSGRLVLENVFNFPNPFARSTSFTFTRATTDAVDVTVKIYTVAGRLISVIERRSLTDRMVAIPWDGRDADGDEVGNGVYFYRIIARFADGSQTAETIGKLAIVR